MNLVEAVLERDDAGIACRVGEQRLALPAETVRARPALQRYAGRTIGLGVRPEQLEDARLEPGGDTLRGKVLTVELLGSELLAHVEVEAAPVATQEVREVLADVDRSRVADLESEARAHRTLMVGRFGVGSGARAGEDVEMRVNTRRLYFFDLETEAAIGGATEPVSD
jgi:multiple sugar transport system ATP-binding protein